MNADTFPVVLSLQVSLLALAIVTPVGLFLAYVQARFWYPLRGVVDGLILLPMVLPPSVVGFFLIMVLGRRSPVGQWLERLFELRLTFTPLAAVIASAVVALPILVKAAQPAIEAVSADLEDVARSLGLGPVAIFFRVTLRSAWRGVASAIALAFARAVGEFGATLMFAGNIPGRTNTMPLEIFAAYQGGDDARALTYVVILTIICGLVVLVSGRLAPRAVAR